MTRNLFGLSSFNGKIEDKVKIQIIQTNKNPLPKTTCNFTFVFTMFLFLRQFKICLPRNVKY